MWFRSLERETKFRFIFLATGSVAPFVGLFGTVWVSKMLFKKLQFKKVVI